MYAEMLEDVRVRKTIVKDQSTKLKKCLLDYCKSRELSRRTKSSVLRILSEGTGVPTDDKHLKESVIAVICKM